ncbi:MULTISPECIES: hypothetical protein [unclassified Streptomyces]|uniref:hypothetical protein n=1 Tax=unclassified Streptomyces TaxID=2593676 RepID=UPI001BEBC2B6|nr:MULTISPECIES: hypothetical protein [unclassified Streptomyces]MBT2406664.1 hypothetical protein [Streptomyces sp. ISL-21]MBT2457300.1 hypothetical protein [Streptomyces sp. ISL-86]MBT2613676.1 hypothetical protein [Streptomyces sp. ISL-87]
MIIGKIPSPIASVDGVRRSPPPRRSGSGLIWTKRILRLIRLLKNIPVRFGRCACGDGAGVGQALSVIENRPDTLA